MPGFGTLVPGGTGSATATAIAGNALVLVNSNSTYYPDFQHYIKPYLDNFGVPYTVLDIATAPVTSDVGSYSVIIIGHCQLGLLDATEQAYISAAVKGGTGLVNFDNDLSADGVSPRYQFIQDIFGFGYTPARTGSGVTFTSIEGGGSNQINCCDPNHQNPVLTTTTNSAALIGNDSQWTQFLRSSAGYPADFAGYNETPPLMHYYGSVPDGNYTVVAHLYWSHNLRYYWGYTAGNPKAYSIDVTSGNTGDFADYTLGNVTVSNGQFNIYVQNADPLPGGFDDEFWGWAWIRLLPVGGPPPTMHYITALHQAGESISTGSMTMAGITLPTAVTALATTSGGPLLAVTTYGQGNAVQWGSYDWMSYSVKGPMGGLDDLVWRSIVWAARKPFVMQGLPPFVTMRVDDVTGPFSWIHIANEFGIKPWVGLFVHNVSDTAAADLSALVNAGNATAAIHAFGSSDFFYCDPDGGDLPDATVAANFAEGAEWMASHNIPISKLVVPHHYEFGTNVFQGLKNWGVEFVGIMQDPGNKYGAPWIMNGPYRLYDTGSSSSVRWPVYYADFITVPNHPEFNGQFFNCVTEIRDDNGYEWHPTNDVTSTIAHGTAQTERALNSMALATLFTHDYYVQPITPDNWHAILKGITDNLAPYNPIYVTMDYACQYIRAMYTSNIVSSAYDPVTRQISVNLGGHTDMTTMFYLFTAKGNDISQVLVDVPTFSGSTQVNYTVAGPLDHIVITPPSAAVASGSTQQFTALGYDADNNPIPNLPFTWSVVNGGGTVSNGGLFTAGQMPGQYDNTVYASFGGINGYASVKVVGPALNHFTFESIASLQYVGTAFNVTIEACDISGNLLTNYVGQAALSDSRRTITPSVTGNFAGGQWTGNVTISTPCSSDIITATDGTITGSSTPFDVLTRVLYRFKFAYISTPHTAGAKFPITITSVDAQGNTVSSYTGKANLSDLSGSITPGNTANFRGGTWTGNVTIFGARHEDTITATDGNITGTSNYFAAVIPEGKAVIYGMIFDDTNANGVLEYGEAGIKGVTINLYGWYHTSTDSNGIYSFLVSPGTYKVEEAVPQGFHPTTLATVEVTVAEGQYQEVDFGNAGIAEPISIMVIPGNATIAVGGKQQFTATAVYANGNSTGVTAEASWASSKENVATVVAGLASAKAAGTTDITATFGKLTSNMAALNVAVGLPWPLVGVIIGAALAAGLLFFFLMRRRRRKRRAWSSADCVVPEHDKEGSDTHPEIDGLKELRYRSAV